jgi:hypothetical protein
VVTVVQIADQLMLMMLPQLLLFGRPRSASPDSCENPPSASLPRGAEPVG